MRGFLEYLGPVYSGASPNSPLHDATHAVALSTFGRHPDRGALLREARMKYGRALHKVNGALKDPTKAKSDETLLTILLFSLYEVSEHAAMYQLRPQFAGIYSDCVTEYRKFRRRH